MLFAPHGDISVSVEGRLLLVEVRGPWNAELIEAYSHHSAPIITGLAESGPWGAIVMTRHSALFTVDGERRLRMLVQQPSRVANRVATCYVIGPEVEGYRLCEPLFREIYCDLTPFEVFEALPAARAWAERLIVAATGAS